MLKRLLNTWSTQSYVTVYQRMFESYIIIIQQHQRITPMFYCRINHEQLFNELQSTWSQMNSGYQRAITLQMQVLTVNSFLWILSTQTLAWTWYQFDRCNVHLIKRVDIICSTKLDIFGETPSFMLYANI